MKQSHIRKESSGFDALQIREVPKPVPGPGEVQVKVEAVALNQKDLLFAAMNHPDHDFIPLSDAAGTVTAIGEGVTDVKVGDPVTTLMIPDWLQGQPTAQHCLNVRGGLITPGVLAEYVIGKAQSFVGMPPHLSFEEAATISCAGVTAWHAVTRGGVPQAGQWVMIMVTGGVSLFALQLQSTTVLLFCCFRATAKSLKKERGLAPMPW